jgi:TonB-dependent Receptor Plug Domain
MPLFSMASRMVAAFLRVVAAATVIAAPHAASAREAGASDAGAPALDGSSDAGAPPAAPARPVEEVTVHGRAADRLRRATTSSEGSVGAEDLEDQPLLRRGELFESVPGMVVTQHSGDGKANQYFLRGFNLDHGTDFAFSIDGVPVNLPSHAHGQGYSDLNFLIPELIAAIDYKKGPFYPDVGDFSGAGAANVHLVSSLPQGLANLQVGMFNYARALLADSPRVGPGTLLVALEYNHYDGPWDLPENSNRYNGLLRYHVSAGRDDYSATANLYFAPLWHSTDQVPRRAIDEGVIGRFGAMDPTDGGRTGRGGLSFDWTRREDDGTTQLVLYGFYYWLNLWSDFDYALVDPVHLDQFEQVDRRFTAGGEWKRMWRSKWWGANVQNTLGVQLRNDFIPDSGLNKTANRQVLSTDSKDRIEEASFGVYGDDRIQWTPWLRTELGLRADVYGLDVDSATLAANSGSNFAAIVSPKGAIVLGPWARTEFYVDAGTGFHSNDARGVTIAVDAAGAPQGRVPLLVRTTGAEIGARTAVVPGLVSTLSLFYLRSDSELTFAGDSGDTEPNGPTRRYGVEWANLYKPLDWLTLSADVSYTYARYLRPQDSADGGAGFYIANSIPLVLSAAARVETPVGIFASLRLRYFSSQPVLEDNALQQPASTLLNALVGYRFKQYEVAAEVLNVLDAKADDIAYAYPSRIPDALLTARGLPPEPAGGVNGIVIHPVEPLQVRASLTAHF